MPVRVSEAIRMLLDEGWFEVAQKGSHRQFKHPTKPGRVTIPGRPNDELHPKTWRSILRQAGIEE